jgi:hypothetical protein
MLRGAKGRPGSRVLIDVLHRVKRGELTGAEGRLELFPRRSSVRHAAPADSG